MDASLSDRAYAYVAGEPPNGCNQAVPVDAVVRLCVVGAPCTSIIIGHLGGHIPPGWERRQENLLPKLTVIGAIKMRHKTKT